MSCTSTQKYVWKLDDLYDSPDDPAIESDKNRCINEAKSFAESYSYRIESLSADEFYSALVRIESIEEQCKKIVSFSFLTFATGTDDPKKCRLWQSAKEFLSLIRKKLLFFSHAWIKLCDKTAERIISNPKLSCYRHYLAKLREGEGHRLSEPEEKVIEAFLPAGNNAWTALFDKITGHIRFGDKKKTLHEVLSDLYSPSRRIRKEAANVLFEGLNNILYVFSHILNTIVLEKAVSDDLRSYKSWLSQLNMKNEISDNQVKNLVKTVTSKYDIVQRYYKIKKKILGYSRLFDYDRYAPIAEDVNRRYSFCEAKDLVLDAFYNFSSKTGDVASLFFEKKWIDAVPKKGKISGAFSHPTVPSAHPYILLNYYGTYKDLMTLAHELGHGVHQYMCRKQGLYNSDIPLTISEIPSVFGEMLLFYKLCDKTENPEEKLGLLCNRIEDCINTIFRQNALFRFENELHEKRRSKGEPTPEEINDIWMLTQKEMYKESVFLNDYYKTFWAYIPHFIHYPGYVYSYSFAKLTALCLFQKYSEKRSEFVKLYIELLQKGGKFSPEKLLRPFNIDINEPDFLHQGIEIVNTFVKEAKNLYEKIYENHD